MKYLICEVSWDAIACELELIAGNPVYGMHYRWQPETPSTINATLPAD